VQPAYILVYERGGMVVVELSRFGGSTVGTEAKEDKMIGVDLIAGLFFELGKHGGNKIMIDHFYLITLLANEMMVGMFTCQFVDDLVALQMGGRNQTEPHQEIKGAIDGGAVDGAAFGLHALIDFLWRAMVARFLEDIENDLALWRQAKATLLDNFTAFVVHRLIARLFIASTCCCP
jgi:hypothetical protein